MTKLRMGVVGAGAVALCFLLTSRPAVAQHPTHMKVAVPHMKPSTHPAPRPHMTPAEREREKDTKAFSGVASRLGMTPEAMDDAFEAAHQANHRLSRGEFIAANMLAHDLGSTHPNITTQALLDQLKTRNNLGRALQTLGLTRQQAKQAMKTADREVKEADKAAKASDRDRDRTPDTH